MSFIFLITLVISQDVTWLSEKLYHDTESLLPNTLLLWTLGQIYVLLKKPWCWERLKAGGEGDDRGWDGWMASPTRWTWVWVNSGSWWWTGRPGVLQSMGSQRPGHDWATELNWYITGGVFFFAVWVWKTLSGDHDGFASGASSKEPSGSISGWGRVPWGGHGNPVQYSCLENPRGQRSLVGYLPWCHRVRHDWAHMLKIQLCLLCYC